MQGTTVITPLSNHERCDALKTRRLLMLNNNPEFGPNLGGNLPQFLLVCGVLNRDSSANLPRTNQEGSGYIRYF